MGKAQIVARLGEAIAWAKTKSFQDTFLGLVGTPKEPMTEQSEMILEDGLPKRVKVKIVRRGRFVGEFHDARKYFVLVGAHKSGFYQQERMVVEEVHRKEWMMHPKRDNKFVQRTIVEPEHTIAFGEPELKRSQAIRGFHVDIRMVWHGKDLGWVLDFNPHVDIPLVTTDEEGIERAHYKTMKVPESIRTVPFEQLIALAHNVEYKAPEHDTFADARKKCYALSKRMGKGHIAIRAMQEVLSKAGVAQEEASSFLDRLIEQED
jgi:hypothetical protein